MKIEVYQGQGLKWRRSRGSDRLIAKRIKEHLIIVLLHCDGYMLAVQLTSWNLCRIAIMYTHCTLITRLYTYLTYTILILKKPRRGPRANLVFPQNYLHFARENLTISYSSCYRRYILIQSQLISLCTHLSRKIWKSFSRFSP